MYGGVTEMKIVLLSFFLSVAFTTTITSYDHNSEATVSPLDPPIALKQSARKRNWREVIIDTVFSISTYQGKPILNPGLIKVDSKGRIYVLDLAETAILKFSETGEYLARYGKGKGRGPGEFHHPVDYSVSPTGDVFVIDAKSAFITVFRENGNVRRTVRVQGIPNRIVHLGKDQFVISQIGRGDFFERFSNEGRPISLFGRFFQDQENYVLPINIILTSSNSRLIGAFEWSGHLFCFKDDTLVFFRESIDGLPMQKFEVVQQSEGDKKTIIVRPSSQNIHAYRELSVSESSIFLLAQDVSKKLGKVVIDVYDENDGTYLFSFSFSKLPGTEGITSIYFATPFFTHLNFSGMVVHW
jgi:hypothetical protein